MIRPPRRRDRQIFSREDLLAVPLCVLWGIAMAVWSVNPWALGESGGATEGISTLFTFIWGIPMALAKYLFGF